MYAVLKLPGSVRRSVDTPFTTRLYSRDRKFDASARRVPKQSPKYTEYCATLMHLIYGIIRHNKATRCANSRGMTHQLEVDMSLHSTTYQCLFCGKVFTPSRKRDVALYCSRGCVMRKNAIAARIPPRNCIQCGAEYQSKNRRQKYCTIRCAKLHHHAVNPELSQRPILDRFWARIEKTDTCWNWTRSKSKAGYGFMSIKGVHMYMHRFSYELHFGVIPDGLYVCHRCDNPSCVRPEHLFLGTALENTRDCIAKGRDYNARRKTPPKTPSPNQLTSLSESRKTTLPGCRYR
jgi:hypothetical protein